MKVSEVFGPTVQGEGPSTGRRCGFIRLGGCNLECVWCDTPYTWDWKGKNGQRFDPSAELRDMDPETLVAMLTRMNVDMAVITGGEPLVQSSGVADLVSRLNAAGMSVEIETNGTRPIPAGLTGRRVRFNVSPKLSNSGEPYEKRVKPAVLSGFAERADTAFKFVVADQAELGEVREIVEAAHVHASQVWVMPEGKTPEAVSAGVAAIADAAIRYGWNVTPRLHVIVWGDRRGV